jgi:hypothetical protein
LAYLYHYDDKGNVIQEDLWGDITGNGKKLIRSGDQFPQTNQAECFTIKRQYTQNNLLFREIFPNGSIIEYHYYNGTDRLHAKYHYDQNKMMKREFFIYDGSILVREIVDDGYEKDVNHLSGVTERLIKKITPRKNKTFSGFPEIIEEMYWDCKRGKEVLLKKQIIEYNQKGLVSKISHYDENGSFAYDLIYNYDNKGRLTAQTDPLGRKRSIALDGNDNPIFDKDPNEAFSVHQKYDYSNRPIQEEKNAINNEKRALHFEYNLLSQKRVETNEQGGGNFFQTQSFWSS